MHARRHIGKRHQVIAVGTDVDGIVIDRVFVPADRPLQAVCTNSSRKRYAVIDPGLKFCAFLVIVPCDQLQIGKGFACAVKSIDLSKSLQPGLATLLAHDAIRSPGRERIVKALVGSSHGLFTGVVETGFVETGEISQPVIAVGRHHPRIAAAA